MLCLLSNAVKYSINGEVIVTVSLEDRVTSDDGSSDMNLSFGVVQHRPHLVTNQIYSTVL